MGNITQTPENEPHKQHVIDELCLVHTGLGAQTVSSLIDNGNRFHRGTEIRE